MSARERISKLPLGVPIPFDIQGNDGAVVIPKGTILTERDVQTLYEKGVLGEHASSKEKIAQGSDVEQPLVPKPYYSGNLIQKLQQSTEAARRELEQVIKSAYGEQALQLNPLQTIIGDVIDEITEDVSAVLSHWSSTTETSVDGSDDTLVNRCVQLSTLSSVIACSMGMPIKECKSVALAGMLHDISLFDGIAEEFNRKASKVEVNPRNRIMMHPLRSSEMLSVSPNVPTLVRVIVTQVHEQMDGSGYPRNLRSHQLNPLARILNLVDAYLAMLEPHSMRVPIVPADALVYLLHHTVQGKFDKACMQALLAVSSIYPVGTKVQLDDDRVATVMMSNEREPTRPLVRIDRPPFSLVDLSQGGPQVKEPYFDLRASKNRLKASQIKQVLWIHPLLSYGK